MTSSGSCTATTGVDRLARDVMRVIERAVPFDAGRPADLDPATLLPDQRSRRRPPRRHVDGVDARFIEIELREPDFNKFCVLARQGRRAASLSAATRGDLEQSLRYRELCRPIGFGDELRVVCSDSDGTWGALNLARESGRPLFRSLGGQLPRVARSALGRRPAPRRHPWRSGDSRPARDRRRRPRRGQLHRARPPQELSACSPISPPMTHWVRNCRLPCWPWRHERGASPATIRPILTVTTPGRTRSPGREFAPHKGIG